MVDTVIQFCESLRAPMMDDNGQDRIYHIMCDTVNGVNNSYRVAADALGYLQYAALEDNAVDMPDGWIRLIRLWEANSSIDEIDRTGMWLWCSYLFAPAFLIYKDMCNWSGEPRQKIRKIRSMVKEVEDGRADPWYLLEALEKGEGSEFWVPLSFQIDELFYMDSIADEDVNKQVKETLVVALWLFCYFNNIDFRRDWVPGLDCFGNYISLEEYAASFVKRAESIVCRIFGVAKVPRELALCVLEQVFWSAVDTSDLYGLYNGIYWFRSPSLWQYKSQRSPDYPRTQELDALLIAIEGFVPYVQSSVDMRHVPYQVVGEGIEWDLQSPYIMDEVSGYTDGYYYYCLVARNLDFDVKGLELLSAMFESCFREFMAWKGGLNDGQTCS